MGCQLIIQSEMPGKRQLTPERLAECFPLLAPSYEKKNRADINVCSPLIFTYSKVGLKFDPNFVAFAIHDLEEMGLLREVLSLRITLYNWGTESGLSSFNNDQYSYKWVHFPDGKLFAQRQ